uniref:Protein kinase domain-containing protein n=1 Tax=Acrobeloides nanus TaxID=290746 RepID=A0A914D0P4_9BILA
MSCKEIDGRYRVEINSKSDLWSLGITLVEIARFSQPYTHCELIKDVYYSISMKESPVLTPEDGYSVETIQLVNNCLIKDERRRPSLEDISEIDLIQKYGDFESNKAYMKNFICKYVHMYNGIEEDSVGSDSSDSSIIEETIQQWKNDSLVNFMSFDNIVACH